MSLQYAYSYPQRPGNIICEQFNANVTFVVYTVPRPYGSVSASFWATLRSVTLYVVMTAHEY